MKIFSTDLNNIRNLVDNYNEGDSIEIFDLTVKGSTPELISIISLFRHKTYHEIIINTEENLDNALLRLAVLKQYPNLIIRNEGKDFKLS